MGDDISADKVDAILGDKTAQEDDLELELDNDPFYQNIREQRMAQLKKQMEDLEAMKQNAHGVYSELEHEKDFLPITTSTERVVCHFFHKEFFRCKVVDKHLSKHFKTKFVKLDVEKSPFFVEKLQVKVLPCIISFVKGVAVDRIVGFEELGSKDDFSTAVLEKRLSTSTVLSLPSKSSLKVKKKKGSIFGKSGESSSEEDY